MAVARRDGTLKVGLAALAVAAALAGAAPAPGAAPLPIRERVLHAAEFGPLNPLGAAPTIKSASAWSARSGMSLSSVRGSGFVAGIWEQLQAPVKQWVGLSCVAQFGSPAGAGSAVAQGVASAEAQAKANGGTAKAFAVPGIPGARGFALTSRGSAGFNVEFADGPFWYLVGVGFAAGNAQDAKVQLLAAVHRLYMRVHGR